MCPAFPLRAHAAAFSVVLSLAVLVIVAGAHVYLRAYRADFRTGAERSLSAMADLKASEIARWRLERVGDAEVLSHNEAFAALVRAFLGDGGTRTPAASFATGWNPCVALCVRAGEPPRRRGSRAAPRQ